MIAYIKIKFGMWLWFNRKRVKAIYYWRMA